jgi:23S rRNA pseudouridine1911/1915/1917 synthase
MRDRLELRRIELSAIDDAGLRLDRFLTDNLSDMTRTRAHDLIATGKVQVAGRSVRPSYRLQRGDAVSVRIPAPVPSSIVAERIPLQVVYEDEDMLVLDKPPGIAVHPAPGHEEHTLVNALLARYPRLPGIGGTERPGIVHRLDLDTSGLLMVAKSERGVSKLGAQLEAHSVKKGYLALLKGTLKEREGLIDAPIARDPTHRKKMAVVRGGRQAATRYHTLDAFKGLTLILAKPETGRTHQIRVHFAALGAPVAGDQLYGGAVDYLDRQFLHAAFLRVARPSDGTVIALESVLPADLRTGLVDAMQAGGIGAEEIRQRIDAAIAQAKRAFAGDSLPKERATRPELVSEVAG